MRQGKTAVLREKPVPVPLCPPQIPYGLTRERTRASAVRGRRLTAWAMSRPVFVSLRRMFFALLTSQCHARGVLQTDAPALGATSSSAVLTWRRSSRVQIVTAATYFLPCMEPEGSLPCSQESAIFRYYEPHQTGSEAVGLSCEITKIINSVWGRETAWEVEGVNHCTCL
jgi:hypothetical protein